MPLVAGETDVIVLGLEVTVIWVFANWTPIDELRGVVRHEAAHLAFARTHTAEESAGHSGPSEDFARAFEDAPPS